MIKQMTLTTKEEWKPFGRIAVFIDTANIMYTQRSMGWSIDFKKLRAFFEKHPIQCSGMYMYLALWHTDGKKREQDKKFESMLRKNGYRVVSKDSKRVAGETKGNCDVELTIDAVRFMSHYDTCILFSGDGDFAALAHYLRDHNKKVIAVSFREHISYELIRESDIFLSLDKWETDLKYKKKKA